MTDNSSGNNMKDFGGNPSPLAGSEQAVGGVPQPPQSGTVNIAQPTTPSTTDQMQSMNSSTVPSGSGATQVQQPQVNVQPQTQPVQPLAQVPYKKPTNPLKFILLILFMVILGVGGYLGYKNFMGSKTQNENSDSTQEESQSDSETPTEVMEKASPTEIMKQMDSMSEQDSTQSAQYSSEELVDFSKCSPGDGYSRSLASGSTYLSITDIDEANSLCVVEILNPSGSDYFKYSCNIPKSVGKITFKMSENGSDFSEIMSYCSQTKSGSSTL